jgi:hypothetical protein
MNDKPYQEQETNLELINHEELKNGYKICVFRCSECGCDSYEFVKPNYCAFCGRHVIQGVKS